MRERNHLKGMAKCILFGCAYFLPLLVFGRIINGTIRDDNHLHPLGNIAVSIYLEADSTLIATDTTGESGSFHLHWSTLSINHDLTTPNHFQLYPNYPNPFNPSTMVPLEVPTTGNYTLTAFNLLGQVISRKSFMLNSGLHTISYGGGGAGAGLQLIKLEGAGYRAVRKITLLDGGNGQGFKLTKNSIQTGLPRIVEDQIILFEVTGETIYPHSEQFTVTSSNLVHDIEVRLRDYSPVYHIKTIHDTIPEDYDHLPLTIGEIVYSGHPITAGGIEFFFSNESPNIGELDFNGPYIRLLNLNPNQNGVLNYKLITVPGNQIADTLNVECFIEPVNDPPIESREFLEACLGVNRKV